MTQRDKPPEDEDASLKHSPEATGELSAEGRDAIGDLTPEDFMRENSGVLKALRAAYSEIIDEPMPDRFMQLLSQLDEGDQPEE